MAKFNEKIKRRKENNQNAFKRSFLDLAGVKISDKPSREDFIVSQLMNYFKMNTIDFPNHVNSLKDKISYLSNNSGLLLRKIELKNTWFLEYREPLLVFTKDTNVPILLIPMGQRHYYYISYSTGKKVIGTVLMARKLKTEAYAFYRELPTHQLTFKEYFKYFRKSIRAIDLVWVTLFSMVAVGIGMLLPYLMKRLTGEVVINKDLNLYWMVAIYVISAGIAYILIKSTQAFMNARVAIKIEKTMQATTMMRILSLPPSFFKKYTTGELVARYNSVTSIASLIFNGVFLTLLSTVMSLAFMTQIVQFTPTLVLPVVLILVITALFSIVVSLIQIKVSRKQMLLSTKESGSSYAIISGIQKIRLAGAEKRAFAMWAKDYSRSSELLYHPPLIIRLSPAISIALSLIGEITIYYLAARNNVDTSSFVAFTTSFASLTMATNAAVQISTVLSKFRPALDMAKPILEEEAEDSLDKERVESLSGDIKLDHVSFKYDDTRMILDDISMNIKEGEYVGIVGKTGCGKTTLVRLLLGFEKVSDGHIYYDDKDINSLNLQSLRSKIGSVTQNGGTFHADIMSNILITAPELKEEDAWRAAEIAGIADDIKRMPMKMRTVISEGQGGISGGQKQRIMIARAIVNKPKILIFDEATSALDNKTQKSISDSISQLKCTRIVIAHRLSTIRHCDRILYMEEGKIVEEGTYDELIGLNGRFKELIERQKVE